MRSTLAIGMPKLSAWTIAVTKLFTSSTSVRSASPRRASARPWPICISRSTRENSSASGPSVLRATCWTAASNAEPGLHADGHQVDRVRQLALHPLRAVVDRW